jgi:hypothetical protein
MRMRKEKKYGRGIEIQSERENELKKGDKEME